MVQGPSEVFRIVTVILTTLCRESIPAALSPVGSNTETSDDCRRRQFSIGTLTVRSALSRFNNSMRNCDVNCRGSIMSLKTNETVVELEALPGSLQNWNRYQGVERAPNTERRAGDSHQHDHQQGQWIKELSNRCAHPLVSLPLLQLLARKYAP